MTKSARHFKGFTLLEILISLVILVLVWVAVVGATVISQFNAAFAKHKLQAVYVIQRTLEEMRKKSFSSIALSTTTVSIDTKGTPDNYADDLNGTQIVTVYNDSTYYKRVCVEVRWNEVLLGRNKTMREYGGTYICNDPQAN